MVALLVILGGRRLLSGAAQSGGMVTFPHVHGLGFSADGEQLIVPAHDGLRVYSDGAWSVPDVPSHDYMGYSPVDEGFYSSGHPAVGSSLVNPLGLVKSADEGRSLTQLGFSGVSDFHLMGVGYYSHAIYVFNPAPNPSLPPNTGLPAGMHVSLDDGTTWQPCALQGVAGQPYQIAVHPAEPRQVALATEAGLYLSNDFGNTFILISAGPVTAAAFSPDGNSIVFGALSLHAYNTETGEIEAHPDPDLTGDNLILYIAVNPVRTEELAVATAEIDIYLSADGGKTWQAIAADGTGR